MSDDLLPCPFCGGDARIWEDPSHSSAFFVGCDDPAGDCFGSIHWEETREKAIAAWNRRALPAIDAREKALLADIARGPMQGELMEPWINSMKTRAALSEAEART